MLYISMQYVLIRFLFRVIFPCHTYPSFAYILHANIASVYNITFFFPSTSTHNIPYFTVFLPPNFHSIFKCLIIKYHICDRYMLIAWFPVSSPSYIFSSLSAPLTFALKIFMLSLWLFGQDLLIGVNFSIRT